MRYYIGLSSLTWKKLLSFIWRILTILTTLVSFSVVMHARPIEPIIPLRFALVLLRLFSIPLSPFLLPSRTSHINIFDNQNHAINTSLVDFCLFYLYKMSRTAKHNFNSVQNSVILLYFKTRGVKVWI